MKISEKELKLFWGDLHNHNAVGYAKGSLERSIDIAQEHLDFFAFTGQASWHDIPLMPGDRHMLWVNGFKAHVEHWPKTRRLIREANSNSFVAFLGYEWHSSAFGDYCLIFPEDQPDLFLPDHVIKLLDFASEKGALSIPHHVGYKTNWRGANWDYFRPEVSPVVEIFSEHGCTVSDRSPYPMILHSNGGRATANTIYYQLERGLRFGFVASTDDHFGYPGAYGEGLVGVWAEELSAEALFKAIRQRHTIAVTGDRISLGFTLNGQPMGSELPFDTQRSIGVEVEGQDSVEMIELLRNGRIIQRFFPEDLVTEPLNLPGRAKCRFQYGWGPWSALELERICSWEMTLRLENGRFLKTERCFQSGPFREDLRDRLRQVSENEVHLESFTSRKQAYLEDPTKSIVCDLESDSRSKLIVELKKPSELTVEVPLQKLLKENEITFTGAFTTESFVVHRLVAPEEFSAQIHWEDSRTETDGSDQYHVRVRQHNQQLAWSSPIWIG